MLCSKQLHITTTQQPASSSLTLLPPNPAKGRSVLVEHQQHEATHLHREVEGSLLRVVTDIEAEFMLVIGAGKSTRGSQHQWSDRSMDALRADPEARVVVACVL